MALTIRARLPDFDPAEFWQESLGRQQWRSMIDKYEALAQAAHLAEQPRGDTYRRALVELSSRWPAALREGELIGPQLVELRHAAAKAGLARPDRVRIDWSDESARAVVCWAELHGLIGDLLEFRRASDRAQSRESQAFAEWLIAAPRAERWPEPARIPAVVGPGLRVRSAYLWLAARAGLDLPSLNALLFARAGHWDRRDEDPDWALTC